MSYGIDDKDKAKIEEAHAAIMTAFDTYAQILGIKDAVMHPGLLFCVVTSWVLDENRHTAFHPCNEVKKYKSASYFAYWFTWVKPIQILSLEQQPNRNLVLINEKFALIMAYHLLGIDNKGIVPIDFSEEMLYVLRYRNPNPESLFTTMNLLEISAKSGELWKAYAKECTNSASDG